MHKEEYTKAMEGVMRLLVRKSAGPLKLTYVGELLNGRSFSPKMVCFTLWSCHCLFYRLNNTE